jgi:hypothetical protein
LRPEIDVRLGWPINARIKRTRDQFYTIAAEQTLPPRAFWTKLSHFDVDARLLLAPFASNLFDLFSRHWLGTYQDRHVSCLRSCIAGILTKIRRASSRQQGANWIGLFETAPRLSRRADTADIQRCAHQTGLPWRNTRQIHLRRALRAIWTPVNRRVFECVFGKRHFATPLRMASVRSVLPRAGHLIGSRPQMVNRRRTPRKFESQKRRFPFKSAGAAFGVAVTLGVPSFAGRQPRDVAEVHDVDQFRIVDTEVAVIVAEDSFRSGTMDDHGYVATIFTVLPGLLFGENATVTETELGVSALLPF